MGTILNGLSITAKVKKADLLRERLVEDLTHHDARFNLEIQFQENPDKQPIENTARGVGNPFYQGGGDSHTAAKI